LLLAGRLLACGRSVAGLLAGGHFDGGGRAGNRPVTLPKGLLKLFIFL
jgi:hypothetical protein